MTPEALHAGGRRPYGGRPSRNYPVDATSPLWWLLISVTLYIGSIVLSVAGTFAVARGPEENFVSGLGATWLVGTLVTLAAYVCGIVWLYTIGKNGGTYGVGLVILVVFPIYLLPFVFLGAWGLLIAMLIYFCWPYRLLVSGVWSAGRLPPVWSLLGWVPLAVAVSMIVGAGAISSISTTGDTGSALGFVVAAQLLWAISAMFNLVSVVTVTIIQHLKIREDRAVTQSWQATAG